MMIDLDCSMYVYNVKGEASRHPVCGNRNRRKALHCIKYSLFDAVRGFSPAAVRALMLDTVFPG